MMGYAGQIDNKLRKLGYSRIASNELTMNDQICKIMTYQALGLEEY